MTIRLSQIRDFLAVAETGSIRAAARSLGLTQPALTKSLRQLEAELGAVLVTRSVRGIVPTMLGQAFLARARSIDGDLRRAREEIAQLQGARKGTLSVGASTAPAMGVLPRAVVKLRGSWPQARIRVADTSFPNVLADLRDRLGVAYLFISHDLSVIAHIADRVAVMYRGAIVEEGPVAEVQIGRAHV